MEDPAYCCQRCHYKTQEKGNFVRHLKKKKTCNPTYSNISASAILNDVCPPKSSAFVCSSCHKSYINYSSYRRHVRTCQHNETENVMKELHELRIGQQKLFDHIQTLNHMSQTNSNNQNSNNTQTNSNNTVTQHIVINAFGKEDIAHITQHPNVKRFIAECLRNQAPGLCEYISKKHLNKDCPGNQNVRMLNKKDGLMDVFDGKEWKLDAASRIVEKLLAYAEVEIKEILNQDVIDKHMQIAADEFMEGTGIYLDWDLNGENYEYESGIDEDPNDVQKRKMKRFLTKMVCEYVHRFSKTKV
jgi:hypothetical protein